MENNKYDSLKLENQLCFPLYAASREVIKQYRPHLDALDITYTQYIAMMVFWEEKKITVKDLGKKLFLVPEKRGRIFFSLKFDTFSHVFIFLENLVPYLYNLTHLVPDHSTLMKS